MRNSTDIIKFSVSAGISALVGKRVLNCLWELTYRCTAKCAICSYWRNPSDPKRELTQAEIQEGLGKIYAYGCRVVNFTGGEPTIRHDLGEIVNSASRLGIWTSMVTNGSQLTRERLSELKNAGLDNLFVSLDSTNPHLHDSQRGIKGSYDKVLECMHLLRDYFLTGHRTGGIFCVLSKMNLHEVDQIVKFTSELGVYVVFQPYHENKTGNADFNAAISEGILADILRLKKVHKNVLCSGSYLRGFLKFPHRNSQSCCHAGYKYFSIDPYGFMHPCVDLPSAGHLLKNDISVIRSEEALGNVHTCQGCWYCFRGEADSTLSFRGCLEKAWLGWTVIMRNRSHVRRGREI